jgi:hypothetical protein
MNPISLTELAKNEPGPKQKSPGCVARKSWVMGSAIMQCSKLTPHMEQSCKPQQSRTVSFASYRGGTTLVD